MRFLARLVCASVVLGGVCLAAEIDGKWICERTFTRQDHSYTMTLVFNLKVKTGGKLTGTVTMIPGSRVPTVAAIQQGQFDGHKFSFSTWTRMDQPKGALAATIYEGTVEGDTMNGTASLGGGASHPFEARLLAARRSHSAGSVGSRRSGGIDFNPSVKRRLNYGSQLIAILLDLL